MWIRLSFITLAFLFGCGIVGVSLVSAATVFPTEVIPSTAPVVSHLSDSLLPGHLGYPVMAATQKVQLYFMEGEEQSYERLRIATERWQSAEELIKLNKLDLAVSTTLKGHQYVAETALKVQQLPSDHPLKLNVIQKLYDFRVHVDVMKSAFSDQQKVLLDQALAENEALLTHLGARL